MYIFNQKIQTIPKGWLVLFLFCVLAQGATIMAISLHLMFWLVPSTLPHMQHDGQQGLSAAAIVLLAFLFVALREAERFCVRHFNR